VVEPDRAALPTLGADGTYVAMSVRVRKDSRPRHASGFLPTPEGLPVQAALGQRVRVWRVSDGTWLDPFAAWTTSWGARWSPDGQLLAAFVHRGHQAPSVAVWNSSTTPPRRLTDGDGRWPPRGSSDVRGDYQAPRWLDQDTVIWNREGFGFVTVSLDIPDVIVTLTPEGQHEQWLHDVDDHTLPLSANGSFRSIRESAGEFHLDQIKPRTAERITVARHSGSVSTSQLHVGGWPNGGAFTGPLDKPARGSVVGRARQGSTPSGVKPRPVAGAHRPSH
jgi:hypothetical protein